MTFTAAERIADAVLYEGYVLYPYRASSTKNQYRWQFGVVAPRNPRDDGEPWFAQTECLLAPVGPHPRLSVRLRFLRPAGATGPDDRPWLDGVPHAVDVAEGLRLDTLPVECERLIPDAGIDARVTLRVIPDEGFVRLRVRLENLEAWQPTFAETRDRLLCRSLVGAHLLLSVDGARFISLYEPPDGAEALVATLDNRHTWPVLVGDREAASLMLSSPIVLYDYPAVAAESPNELCDGAEIDEILSLRIMTLTEEEKREARATDPRAQAIIDRVDALTPDQLTTLHGTMRSADFFNPPGIPSPDEASVTVAGRTVVKGVRVWLRPSRRADAMDMFLKDQAATVAGVYRDVDERVYVAVTVDADPAAALHESYGRFFYFDPAEVEPIDGEQEHV